MMLPRSLSLRVLLNSSSNWRGPPKQATMTIKLRLREPGMMIFDGGGGGMGSNHRLVLFTHALCQLSYPAALWPAGGVERPADRHLRVRRCGARKSPQDSNGRVAIRFRPKKLTGGMRIAPSE